MTVENIVTPAKFAASLKKHKTVLALFYWKDCGYCKMFFPTWNEVVGKYKDKIDVIQIEYDVVKNLPASDRVRFYPTISVFKNGVKALDMTTLRTEKNLDKFIRENVLQPAQTSPKSRSPKTKD
jgi:thiol-disulfide isomerase/thioredoxin